MGHTGIKDKDLKGENISTVGVDISDLVLQRGNKEIVLRTWDFGGQVRGWEGKLKTIQTTEHFLQVQQSRRFNTSYTWLISTFVATLLKMKYSLE